MHDISIYRDSAASSADEPTYVRSGVLGIEKILEVIRLGGGIHSIPDLKPSIHLIRQSGAGAKRRKKSLPAFTPAARFTTATRAVSAQKEMTGFMVLDWDNVDGKDVREVKQQLCDWGAAYAVFVSPSGKGLKILLQFEGLTPANYQWVFACMCVGVNEKFGLTLDKSGVDISRLCYFSHDPLLYLTSSTNGTLPAVEILERYAARVPDGKQSPGLAVDDSLLDQGSTRSLFLSYLQQVSQNGLDWKDGRRNGWLLSLTGLKRYGLSAADVVPLAVEYINGQWTADRTEANTIDTIRNNFTRYYRNYGALSTASASGSSLEIVDYLGEQVDAIVERLLSAKILYLEAPTGAGKTTLVCQLAKRLGLKVDLAVPTRVLAEQAKDDTGVGVQVAHIIGSTALEPQHKEAEVLAATYQKIKVLRPRKASVLVVDEAHTLVSDYGWKADAVKDLLRQIPHYEYVLYLSGSMYPLANFLTPDNYLKVEKANRFSYDYTLVQLAPSVKEKEYFTDTIREDCLNVLYWNDKRALEGVKTYFSDTDKKVLLLSRDERDKNEPEFAAAYTQLVDAGLLGSTDVLLTTCFVQAGVNIQDDNRPVHITFAGKLSPVDIIQFTARFRKMRPSVTILHGCETAPLTYVDEKALRKGLKYQIKAYQHTDVAQARYAEDDEAATQRRINQKMDGVLRVEGKYKVDPFYISFRKFDEESSNAQRNKFALQEVLSRHNFTLLGEERDVVASPATASKYGAIGQAISKAKRAGKELIVGQLVGKGYVYQFNERDPERFLLEKRHQFLRGFVDNEQIEKENLLSDVNFKAFMRRVTFLRTEQFGTTRRRLPADVLAEYSSYKQLKASIVVGKLYSETQLKAFVKALPGLGVSQGKYLTAYKVMFDMKPTMKRIDGKQRRVGYTVCREISWSDYQKRKSGVSIDFEREMDEVTTWLMAAA